MSRPQVRYIDGQLSAAGLQVAIVASRFNAFVVDRLVEGAIDVLTRIGGPAASITVVRCPGAYELPVVARRVEQTGRFDAIICLGAVIRGATPHFDYVAGGAANGIAQVAMGASVPVTFGVLTTETIEQAVERAGTKAGNKGADAALAALELVSLYRELAALSSETGATSQPEPGPESKSETKPEAHTETTGRPEEEDRGNQA